MSVVLKMIIKNITNKKARTVLILFSIILSTAVFFSSITISNSMHKTILSSVTTVVGVSDIIISPTEKSNEFVSDIGIQNFKDKIVYAIGELDCKATFTPTLGEDFEVTIKGVELDDLNKVNPFKLKNNAINKSFNGNNVILGEDIVRKYGFKLGDEISVEIGEKKYNFTLWDIAASNGPFSKAITVTNLVIPKQTLSSILNVQGKDNLLYIKLNDSSTKKSVVKLLINKYTSYEVKETFNEDKLQSQLSDITSIFLLLCGIVFFMSAFIIYSSFKVIIVERIPLIGTLRSIGATKARTNIILFGENLLYGVIGGLLGCGAGIGLLYVLSLYMSDIANVSPGLELNTYIQFSFLQLFITFLVSIFLSFVSSIVPILKVSKISIKDIILKTTQESQKNKLIRIIIPIAFLLIAYLITIPQYSQDDNLFLGFAMLFALLALVFFIPYVIGVFIKIFEKLYVWIFGNIGTLAAKNLRENKSVVNNIIMLSISISVLLAINTSGYNSVLSTLNTYKEAKFDFRISIKTADNSFANKISDYAGVQDVYTDYEFNNIKIANSDKVIGTVKAIDPTRFLNYWEINTDENVSKLINDLDTGRNILISTTLRGSLNVGKGDLIKLKTKSGEKEYKIIGYFKAFMNDNDYALVSTNFIKTDMEFSDASAYYIKSVKSPADFTSKLNTDFKKLSPKILTKNQLEQLEVESNQNTISLMQFFCIMAIVIGFFGVINNLILSFIQRKQSLAMFRSVGMSKKQVVYMTLIEAITGGIIGAFMGIIGGITMIYILSRLDGSPLNIQFKTLWMYLINGIIIMVIASIIPVVKSAKLNLIESLRHE